MTKARTSLLRSMSKSLFQPGLVVGLLGLFVVFVVVKHEYDELQDIALNNSAHLIMDVYQVSQNAGGKGLDLSNLMAFEKATLPPDERTVYWITDPSGRVVVQSPEISPELLSVTLRNGLGKAQGYRLAAVTSDISPHPTVVVAMPMIERNEAIMDVLLGVAFGFVLLGLLFALAALRAVRRSVAVINDLSNNIAQKNEHDLSPIDRNNAFAEIEPAIDTLDKLMARLDVALASERSFATNAAHELRTPLAVCLANVQRLKSMLGDPALFDRAAEIELGLKRLVRLVERLLQMSRAQSGLGTNQTVSDINPVIRLLLDELREREPSNDRLIITYPVGKWPCCADPDAIGIILGNLFENALKYASGPAPTKVDAGTAGRVVISNDCPTLKPTDLEAIKHRYVRKASLSDGFGIGLSIVQSLCEQSGCTLEILSPRPGYDRGFAAILTLPALPQKVGA